MQHCLIHVLFFSWALLEDKHLLQKQGVAAVAPVHAVGVVVVLVVVVVVVVVIVVVVAAAAAAAGAGAGVVVVAVSVLLVVVVVVIVFGLLLFVVATTPSRPPANWTSVGSCSPELLLRLVN